MQEGSPKDETDGGDTFDQSSECSESSYSWITLFCSRKGNEFFCEVDEDFIKDEFNLTGLNTLVPHYRLSLDVILDFETIERIPVSQKKIERCAEVLYGLIHARFILSQRGIKYMEVKFKSADFGKCPRTLCQGQHCLPVGSSDTLGKSHVLLFCPKCEETYAPRASEHRQVDGAYFGTTFAHLYMLTHHQGSAPAGAVTTIDNANKYVPKIFGFRVRKTVKQ